MTAVLRYAVVLLALFLCGCGTSKSIPGYHWKTDYFKGDSVLFRDADGVDMATARNYGVGCGALGDAFVMDLVVYEECSQAKRAIEEAILRAAK